MSGVPSFQLIWLARPAVAPLAARRRRVPRPSSARRFCQSRPPAGSRLPVSAAAQGRCAPAFRWRLPGLVVEDRVAAVRQPLDAIGAAGSVNSVRPAECRSCLPSSANIAARSARRSASQARTSARCVRSAATRTRALPDSPSARRNAARRAAQFAQRIGGQAPRRICGEIANRAMDDACRDRARRAACRRDRAAAAADVLGVDRCRDRAASLRSR